jgi:hypothetical protein
MRYRHRPDLRGLMKQAYSNGLSDARVYRQFRSAGVPPRSLSMGLKKWAELAAHAPDLLRAQARRGRWLRQASFRWGRLRGSARHRVWCL